RGWHVARRRRLSIIKRWVISVIKVRTNGSHSFASKLQSLDTPLKSSLSDLMMRCSMKTSVLFAFAILLPVLAYHPPRPSGGEASPDDEMYEVYSAAIRDIFLEWHDGTKSPDELAARLVVVRDHALAYRWDKTEEPAERTLKWAKSAVAVDKSTVEDFKRKCADSISLEARFTLPAKLVLISDHELENSFKNGRSWPSFYERYPNSIGYIV